MTNFSINFSNAWWLLLLIPAFGLTLFSYFRLNKRYRCTRNRIVSIVLHLTIMILSTLLLAGLTFEYDETNEENEVILLVDSSYTLDESDAEIDEFIQEVVLNCDSKYKLGIVKFGYDQVYAVELTNETDKIFSKYMASGNPDTTATDIASALKYAASLFSNPGAARIVLMSDALETDSEARDVIKSIAAQGISVDTVYFPGDDVESEVQIIDATQSVSKVEIDTEFTMDVTVESSYEGPATITPYDNNVQGEAMAIDLVVGTQTVSIPYNFAWGGMHVMSFDISADGDTLTQNNNYSSHIYIETFTEILVIESIDDESESLVATFGEELNVKVVNVYDTNNMPTTLEGLRAFDEVILVNVSNDDLPVGFDEILYRYVYEIGGGLFTVCGNEADSTEDNWTANAYTREDMYGSLYQEMLPTEIVEYTAPIGVVIIVDTSGSMGTGEDSKLYWAMQGAAACLDALSERDHVGIMTLATSYTEPLALTPRTQRDKILGAIAELEEAVLDGTIISGGTVFSPALERAGKALAARTDIEKRHIIIVTDGEPSSGDTEQYQFWAQQNAALGVTMSIVGIESSGEAQAKMEDLLVNHAGCSKENFHNIRKNSEGSYSDLTITMRTDLESPEIKSVNYEDFVPTINVKNSITNKIKQEDMPTLGGYYGVKLKPGATAVLMGPYTPIYSQWDFGKGRVGTFACDLTGGAWSSEFVNSPTGATVLNKIVYALFPTENIRPGDVEATISGDNYTTNLSVFTTLGDGETVKVTVKSPTNGEQVFVGDAENGYSRFTFATKESGLHTVLVQKLDQSGKELSYDIVYKTLAYSKEYDAFADKEEARKLASELSAVSGGVEITDPYQVFENAVEYLHIVIDPRIVFAIIIIVLFLLDVAARKFKWKWPHEIIRDKKRTANLSK